MKASMACTMDHVIYKLSRFHALQMMFATCHMQNPARSTIKNNSATIQAPAPAWQHPTAHLPAQHLEPRA
jgi:hypothetical protein